MEKNTSYKMRPLTWVLLSFLLVLVLGALFPHLFDVDRRYIEGPAVIFAAIVLVVGMVLIRRLNQRLAALAQVAEHVGRGNYLVRSADTGSDSVGELSAAVNAMIDKIQTSVEVLEEQQQELEESRQQLEEQHHQLSSEFDRQSSFGEFLSSLNTVEINTIAANSLKYVMDVAGALFGQFYLSNEKNEISLLEERGVDRRTLNEMNRGSAAGLPMEALRRGEWVVLSSLSGAHLPGVNLGITKADLTTLIAAPVVFQGKGLGVLLLGFLEEFDQLRKLQTQNVLDALGGSLNNALTYKTVQKQAYKLEQANQELLEADRLRSEFVANMSHELRTPLNSIIGFSSVLQKNRNQSLLEKDLNYVEKIHRNGKHLLSLINDILDLSKIEAGRMDVEFRMVRLQDIVRETGDMLLSQAEAKKISFEVEVEEEMPKVETDGDKLRQVLINLLGNALKFTEQGGVKLKLYQSEDCAVVDVQDSGIGIPEDKIETVFEPFRQADAGTTRKFGGTGLGLAISRSIVEMLGGTIALQSELGKGSIFTVKIPLSTTGVAVDADAGDADFNVPAQSDFSGQCILVVDDDADARDLLTNYIAETGGKVFQAESGALALEIAKREKPDLITLDIMMPGLDGWEVLRQLKADPELEDIPVVVVSIIAEKRKATVLGAMDAIAKPVVPDDLLRTLQRALHNRKAQRILVVDDNKDIWELFGSALEGHVDEVKYAENGRVALEVLQTYEPDLVFLDLMMPEMDGLTFLRILRTDKRLLSLPVVVVTAKQLSEAERRELEMRVVDVVEKGDQMIQGRLLQVLKEAMAK